MHGDDKVRHCGDCAKNVYNLAGMTRFDAQLLLEQTEGRVCIRMFRRHDGTVLTSDCPVGLAERTYRAARRTTLTAASTVFALAASVIGYFSFFAPAEKACAAASTTSMTLQTKADAIPVPWDNQWTNPISGGVAAPRHDVVMGEMPMPPRDRRTPPAPRKAPGHALMGKPAATTKR
jgi:hypothetical protein